MAAGNNQDELSMEEILSSIRNILIDDGTSPQVTEEENEEIEEIIEEIEDLNEQDTVYNLSNDMIVEDRPVFEYDKIVDSASDKDVSPIDDIDSFINEDISIDDIIDEPDISLSSMDEAQPQTDDLTQNLTDNLEVDSVDTNEITIEENLLEDIITTEDDDLTANLTNDLEADIAESLSIEEELAVADPMVAEVDDLSDSLKKELNEELLSEPDPIIIEEIHQANDESLMPSFGDSDPIFEPDFTEEKETVISSEPILESTDEPFVPMSSVDESEEIVEDIDNTLTIQEQPSEEAPKNILDDVIADTSSDPFFDEKLEKEVELPETTTDEASEDILNKFASVFEEDQQRKIIEYVAREEISEQTQEWLDRNLQTIVTDIVQKEVARVMARVGK